MKTENKNTSTKTKKLNGGGRKKYLKKSPVKEGQTKFFVDLRDDTMNLEIAIRHLLTLSENEQGRTPTYKDLANYAISKLTEKDIEAISKTLLSEWDIMDMKYREYKEASGENLTFEAFLLKNMKFKH